METSQHDPSSVRTGWSSITRSAGADAASLGKSQDSDDPRRVTPELHQASGTDPCDLRDPCDPEQLWIQFQSFQIFLNSRSQPQSQQR